MEFLWHVVFGEPGELPHGVSEWHPKGGSGFRV